MNVDILRVYKTGYSTVGLQDGKNWKIMERVPVHSGFSNYYFWHYTITGTKLCLMLTGWS